MKSNLSLAAVAMILVTSQAYADTFPTGKSYYGSEVQSSNFRKIDLSQNKPININCGEIIQFSSNGKTFIWKADSIYHTQVPISKFAPKGFDTQGKSMFVAPNEYEYGG
ncbi:MULTISPECIES: CzcE family metal-binding protein [Delftia]|uniref:Heavy-metal resistance protein CzcE n=1 Tax=Delftia lacustris TaxID=558537 RepID=A0A1H3U737_9BURK|nr:MULTISPECIES: CzcE family metal-binding protein [Delftia]EPD37933.1 hypothetical protein HMPREF9701_04003 [Delftia acidovorans CCUG 274B]PZP62233.1 MAG: hypothetical protein DI604_29000 [Delftia acidovorans]SDZ57901.1 Heavy-metal resistance protein CzcE [Delftia lacustris]